MGLLSTLGNLAVIRLKYASKKLFVNSVSSAIEKAGEFHDTIEKVNDGLVHTHESIEKAYDVIDNAGKKVKSDLLSANRKIQKIKNSIIFHEKKHCIPERLRKNSKMTYSEAENLLIEAGFSNISCKPLNNLKFAMLKHPGQVSFIQIDGITYDLNDHEYDINSPIIIWYHSKENKSI